MTRPIHYRLHTLRMLLFSVLLTGFVVLAPMKGYASPADNDLYKEILNSMEEDLTYALEYYETEEPSFKQYDREAEKPLREITEARYQQGTDGIYRSDMEGDGVATIMLTGDLMCQAGQQEAALEAYGHYTFDDNYKYVKSVFANADFVIGNLETMLSERASFYSEENRVDNKPQCNAPSTYLDALKYAGFDMVVNANNHDCDTGVTGIFQTIAHLDQYQFLHTGLFTNTKQKRYTIVEIDGIKVAFLSYAIYFNEKNAHLTATGQNVLLNKYSKYRAVVDVAAAKADGAEYVICYMHWGHEFMNIPKNSQIDYAQELADAGVDYIIGSHPHALQPYDKITAADGRTVPVIYSMGNFVSHMTYRFESRESLILQIKLGRDTQGKVVLKNEGYIPCRTIKSYKGCHYTAVPLTSPYNKGNTTKYAKVSYARITNIIGAKLKVMGTFPLSNTDITQSYSRATYSGNQKKPAITIKDGIGSTLKEGTDYKVSYSNNKNVGTAKITVTGINRFTGTWTGTFTIRPKGVSVKTLSNRSSGIKVTYERNRTQTSGYQIQYSRSRKFSSSRIVTVTSNRTTSKTLKKVKRGKTYYIRVRTYKLVDGKRYCSSWSKTRSIKRKR